MQTLKLSQTGNSVGVVLAEEVPARLKIVMGGSVNLIDTPGGIALTPYVPGFDEPPALGREFMRGCRLTFNALAR